MHNVKILVPFGYPYPVIARQFHSFNNPLLELVCQCFNEKRRALDLVDIGAGIGDTVLLLNANCPQMVRQFICIEGDETFFTYLQTNLKIFDNSILIKALLSSEDGFDKVLVHTHGGTAMALGCQVVRSYSLDSIMHPMNIKNLDIIKIDVDGFDGRVLSGARKILRAYHPEIIFEWHPILYRKAGNDWITPFRVLCEEGYKNFIWFTKYGEFSHFMTEVDVNVIKLFAEYCFAEGNNSDWHFDVVALHESSSLSPITMAELRLAKKRLSKY